MDQPTKTSVINIIKGYIGDQIHQHKRSGHSSPPHDEIGPDPAERTIPSSSVLNIVNVDDSIPEPHLVKGMTDARDSELLPHDESSLMAPDPLIQVFEDELYWMALDHVDRTIPSSSALNVDDCVIIPQSIKEMTDIRETELPPHNEPSKMDPDPGERTIPSSSVFRLPRHPLKIITAKKLKSLLNNYAGIPQEYREYYPQTENLVIQGDQYEAETHEAHQEDVTANPCRKRPLDTASKVILSAKKKSPSSLKKDKEVALSPSKLKFFVSKKNEKSMSPSSDTASKDNMSREKNEKDAESKPNGQSLVATHLTNNKNDASKRMVARTVWRNGNRKNVSVTGTVSRASTHLLKINMEWELLRNGMTKDWNNDESTFFNFPSKNSEEFNKEFLLQNNILEDDNKDKTQMALRREENQLEELKAPADQADKSFAKEKKETRSIVYGIRIEKSDWNRLVMNDYVSNQVVNLYLRR